ncbi:MAG TPA: HAD hydrolase-like protein [Stellaceae bacterium]|nr:HAD hydrolase-like protein [Stellaceae bacterium]
MPFISFEHAWREYRRSERRLPSKPPPVRPERVAGIREIRHHFDAVILDAWGVLNLGAVPIPRALAAVKELRASGVPLLVLSNDAAIDRAAAAENHRRRGYPFNAEDIVAGLDLLPEALAALALEAPPGLIADPSAPMQALTAAMPALGEDPGIYDQVPGIVFLSADQWSERKQDLLRESLVRRPRPLIVCNPDIASPETNMLNAEPGFYAHRIADETGDPPILCGKPDGGIYRKALGRLGGIRPERVLCVGDTLHTDILGGRAAGCRAMLVQDGFCAARDALTLAAECGIWPDFVAPGL